MAEPENNKPVQSRGFQKGQSGNPAGRPKGQPNKTTALLKDAILQAATNAGGKEGLVGYLEAQAVENPAPFMSLLGKVLPMQVNHGGNEGGPIAMPALIALVPPDDDSAA